MLELYKNSYCILDIDKIISSLGMKYYELFEGKKLSLKIDLLMIIGR